MKKRKRQSDMRWPGPNHAAILLHGKIHARLWNEIGLKLSDMMWSNRLVTPLYIALGNSVFSESRRML